MALLGIDIGTTSLKCVAFDDCFSMLAETYREYPLIHKDRGVEQNPEEWWNAAVSAVHEIASLCDCITGIGVSSQGITIVPVDICGMPLSNALTWLDMRAHDECLKLNDLLGSESIFRTTGKRLNQAYTLPKLMWLKNNRPNVYDKTYKFLTAHDYIISRFCGAYITEDSLAAGTMAYDITKKDWSWEILETAGINRDKLPDIKASGSLVGKLTEKAASEIELSAGVDVFAGGQDQKCAAYGAGISKKTVTVSLGTSCAVSALFDKPVFTSDMSLPCFPFIDGKNWVLEGFGSTAGASIKWFRNNLAKGRSYSEIDNGIAEIYHKPSDIMFFPFLGGTGSPEWYDAEGGGFIGLTLDTGAADMAKSVLESIAFTIRANLEKMEAYRETFDAISVFGGGAYSDIWLRIIADVTGKTVTVPRLRETACLGAAMKCSDIDNKVAIDKTFSPDMTKKKYYNTLYSKYKYIEKRIYGG